MSSATGLELSCDERRQAEFLANLNKTNHYEVVLKAGDMERAIRPRLASRRSRVVNRIQTFMPHCYRVISSKWFCQHGGDELLAGYPWRYYTAANGNATPDEYLDILCIGSGSSQMR